jgi:enoyl-[acyl-carrier protein] reductase II
MSADTPVKSTAQLDHLWKRGKEFLGTELPIMCGAMTWISDPQLVSRMSNLGAFGVLAAGNMPPEMFADYVEQTRRLTQKPFAGNVITIAPNYLPHLDILCEQKVGHIVFAGSIPRQTEVQKAKDSGAKVLCFASTESIAKRMIDYGADALILEGSEAGGHIGHVSTTVLLQEILFQFPDTPIFVAGGIGTGKMVAHLVLMGAAGAQMGTRFVMAEECNAHPDFKKVFIRARAREAISTPQYSAKLPVVSVRALNNHAMTHFGELQLELLQQLKDGAIGRQEAQYKVEEYWVGSLRKAAVDGDIEHGSLMAGQSVGMLDKVQPLQEILQEIVDDADKAVSEVRARLG